MVCAVKEVENSTLFWGEGGKCDQDAQKFNFIIKCLNTFVAHCSFVRGKKKWSEKMSTERFQNVTGFVINLWNNKTFILLNLAEYRLILADEAVGLVG